MMPEEASDSDGGSASSLVNSKSPAVANHIEDDRDCDRGGGGGSGSGSGSGDEGEGEDEDRDGDEVKADFDYDLFLRRMRHPACRPLIVAIKQFIVSFKTHCSNGVSSGQLVHRYRDFLDIIMERVRENPVWRLMGDVRPAEYELAREGIEYLLMNQLHSVVFALGEDKDRDSIIERKMILFGDWIKPAHLDISRFGLDEQNLAVVISEFRRVNEYLTPRDKLICLLNGCQSLHRLMEGQHGELGADEMIPGLIFVILKCRVGQFYSNLQYISRYRDPRQLASLHAYHFTSLLAVATFIEKMDQKSLLIDEEEYDQRMEEGMMRINAKELDERENERLAADLAHLSTPPQTAKTPLMSPDARFREEAAKLYVNVKQKLKVGATKSIDYLGKLMDDAETHLKAAFDSGKGSPRTPDPATLKAMEDEEEFQLQLAMALSISEQEFQETSKSHKEAPADVPLIDTQEPDSRPCNVEPS